MNTSPWHYSNSDDPIGPLLGQMDPLGGLLGQKYTDWVWNKYPSKGNEILYKIGKPAFKHNKAINPLRKFKEVDAFHEWTERKPGTAVGSVAGLFYGGKALGGMMGQGGGGLFGGGGSGGSSSGMFGGFGGGFGGGGFPGFGGGMFGGNQQQQQQQGPKPHLMNGRIVYL